MSSIEVLLSSFLKHSPIHFSFDWLMAAQQEHLLIASNWIIWHTGGIWGKNLLTVDEEELQEMEDD